MTVKAKTIEKAGKAATRYEEKRDAIIAATAEIINHRGVRAMTLTDVAASVGLVKNSVTYYFKKREDLAVACFLSGIERLEAIIARAVQAPTSPERLHRLLELYFELDLDVRMGRQPVIPIFSDIRALSEPNFDVVVQRYLQLFQRAMAIFDGKGCADLTENERITRTHIVLEQIYWSVAWLPQYDTEDYPRLLERMYDVLAFGLAKEGAAWAPRALDAPEPLDDSARDAMLLATTRLINQRGYRGVSVDAISEEINLTKGAVYHHHDAKSDLVIACFERSFDIIRRLQHQAIAIGGTAWGQISAAASALIAFQTSDSGPLLRTSALQTLPEDVRTEVVHQSNALANRFAAMISDGVADGSVRAVDPIVAAQVLSATVNVAAEMMFWTPTADPSEGPELYARPILMGLLAQ